MDSLVVKSGFLGASFPEDESISYHLRKSVGRTYLDQVFSLCADTGTSYTFGQALDQTSRFSSALKAPNFGLERGSYVAICLPSVAEYFSIFLGITEANLVAVLLNPVYTESELESMLANIPIAAMVTLPEIADRTENLRKAVGIETVITLGKSDSGHLNYFDLVLNNMPSKKPLEYPFDSEETAFIAFSSGSTGVPKGAEISHRNVISQLGPTGPLFGGEDGSESMYLSFPLFHIAGMMFMLTVFHRSWKMITMSSRFSVPKLVTQLKACKPSILALPPTIISIICSCDDLDSEDLKQLKTILYGSAVLGPTLAEKLMVKVGRRIPTVGVYGCTESTCFSTVQPLETATPDNSSVGKVVPHAEMKVIDIDGGNTLGANQRGAVCIRGPMIFKGYVNNKQAYEQTVDADGWLHTGDLGYYDDDGNLFINGRIKDLIKVHSYQVSPEEIENVIRKHDLVEEVVVFGIPDPKSQEVPRAMIVPKKETLTALDIHDFLKDKLAYYKQLRGGVRFVQSLPVTPGARKLNRKAAKAMDEALSINEAGGQPSHGPCH